MMYQWLHVFGFGARDAALMPVSSGDGRTKRRVTVLGPSGEQPGGRRSHALLMFASED